MTGASPATRSNREKKIISARPGIEIARDRPGDHDPGRTGQTLDQAEQYEDCSGGRESTRHGSQEKGDQADDQWASSAQPVRQRTGHELANREADQACSDRQLCRRG